MRTSVKQALHKFVSKGRGRKKNNLSRNVLFMAAHTQGPREKDLVERPGRFIAQTASLAGDERQSACGHLGSSQSPSDFLGRGLPQIERY